METLRNGIAMFLVLGVPAIAVYWVLVHGLVRFWRRWAPTGPLLVVTGCALGTTALLWPWKEALHGRDLGTDWRYHGAGVVLVAMSGWMRQRIGRGFSIRTLIGWDELAGPGRGGGGLVTSGLHGRIRHPRYVQLGVAFVGWSLIAHHSGGYLAAALWLPTMWGIAGLEERELRRRFGASYEEYCRRVPRFLPRR